MSTVGLGAHTTSGHGRLSSYSLIPSTMGGYLGSERTRQTVHHTFTIGVEPSGDENEPMAAYKSESSQDERWC